MDDALEIVRAALLALEIPELTHDRIRPDSSLLDDLGIDSLKFVDLTLGLEERLAIAEFPMQEWVDNQLEAGERLSVAALAEACRPWLVASGAQPDAVRDA